MELSYAFELQGGAIQRSEAPLFLFGDGALQELMDIYESILWQSVGLNVWITK